jgi:hypothetical protein
MVVVKVELQVVDILFLHGELQLKVSKLERTRELISSLLREELRSNRGL